MSFLTPHGVHAPASASAGVPGTFALGRLMAVVLALAPASASASSFAFEPITFKRIPLPAGIHAGSPTFTRDGRHLVFIASPDDRPETQLWITDLRGEDMHCITCSGGPAMPGPGYLNPFPDGRRIFIGFFGVIECAPSVLDCRTHAFLPYDLSTAKPAGGVIPPGGAANTPQTVVRQGAYPTLAPDGEHIGYSDVRSDGFEQMTVARLVRQTDRYVAVDPRVINPPGPTSAADSSVSAWSDSAALHELKTFTHGGASVTYVQGGGAAAENPDVWEVDLQTGVRKRLTSHPDWDEDFAGSPDGRSFAVWSNRTLHMWDGLGGLMPFRSFIDAPMVGAEAGMLINAPNNIACGGVIWLFPSDGDRGGALPGQPIIAPDVHVHDNVTGWPAWSRDGTMLALNALEDGAGLFSGRTPPFLLIAEFPAREPSTPVPVVSSDVGAWAPAPADWHPAFGFVGSVTLQGPGGGSVTVDYGGKPGALFGSFSETYRNYSEDGTTFLNGTKVIDVPGFGITQVHERTHLTMTGRHTGSLHKDLTIIGGNAAGTSPTYEGTSTVTYDGTILTGPPPTLGTKGSCPERLPRLPPLEATATRVGPDRYAIKVTATIAGMGQNEAVVDTVPVRRARIEAAGSAAYTNDQGVAIIQVQDNPHRPTTLTVTAGDTLAPTTVTLGRPRRVEDDDHH